MVGVWSIESSTHTYTCTCICCVCTTHTCLLKTRISWYCDFSWWSISSTSRDIACPAHKSFISVNQPFMFLSILQHKECMCINAPWPCRLRHYFRDEISTLVYTPSSLCNKNQALLAIYIKMLAHSHFMHWPPPTGCTNVASIVWQCLVVTYSLCSQIVQLVWTTLLFSPGVQLTLKNWKQKTPLCQWTNPKF